MDQLAIDELTALLRYHSSAMTPDADRIKEIAIALQKRYEKYSDRKAA